MFFRCSVQEIYSEKSVYTLMMFLLPDSGATTAADASNLPT